MKTWQFQPSPLAFAIVGRVAGCITLTQQPNGDCTLWFYDIVMAQGSERLMREIMKRYEP